MNEEPKQESSYFFPISAILTLGTGAFTAWTFITNYAYETFRGRGFFDKAQQDLAEKVKQASPAEIASSIRNTYRDVEIGGIFRPGILDRLEAEYNSDVQKVFAEKGAANLVGKWKNALTDSQKTRAGAFAAGATVVMGGLLWGANKYQQMKDAQEAER